MSSICHLFGGGHPCAWIEHCMNKKKSPDVGAFQMCNALSRLRL